MYPFWVVVQQQQNSIDRTPHIISLPIWSSCERRRRESKHATKRRGGKISLDCCMAAALAHESYVTVCLFLVCAYFMCAIWTRTHPRYIICVIDFGADLLNGIRTSGGKPGNTTPHVDCAPLERKFHTLTVRVWTKKKTFINKRRRRRHNLTCVICLCYVSLLHTHRTIKNIFFFKKNNWCQYKLLCYQLYTRK